MSKAQLLPAAEIVPVLVEAALDEPEVDVAPSSTPWVMRTYSGHSSAVASNALYRANLAKGQTGLSVAFDLPPQTGYDPDAPPHLAKVTRTL